MLFSLDGLDVRIRSSRFLAMAFILGGDVMTSFYFNPISRYKTHNSSIYSAKVISLQVPPRSSS